MSKKIHFKGLNGIRAIAAMIVLIFHIDQFMGFFGLKPIGFHETGMAGYGVTLFFVLSGYLITRLLLIEQNEFQKIDMPKFYLRRILRIWPIYYLVIALGVILYLTVPHMVSPPELPVLKTFLLYTFLLSNIGYGLGLGITSITPLWSVGVEEQFYAFWPFVLSKSKNLLRTLVLFILGYLLLKLVVKFMGMDFYYSLINICCFDCMAIGGVGAYLVHYHSKYLRYLYNPFVQIISLGILGISIVYKPVHLFSFIDKEFHALSYLIIILNVSSNPKSLISLESRIFDFIGKISYGIYVYHITIIICLSLIFTNFIEYKLTNSIGNYILVFALTIFSTLGIASLSYKYFELYFLNLKTRYSKIDTVSEFKN